MRHTFLVVIVVSCAIGARGYTKTDQRVSTLEKRQATNADQMVQNILQWLQGVYSQNSRIIRQGTLREYLPPSNTDKPRPFQPGYPPSGFSPEPPFPFPTNPATGGIDIPFPDNEVPQEAGSGGGPPESEPEIPSMTPGEQPGYSTFQPLPTSASGQETSVPAEGGVTSVVSNGPREGPQQYTSPPEGTTVPQEPTASPGQSHTVSEEPQKTTPQESGPTHIPVESDTSPASPETAVPEGTFPPESVITSDDTSVHGIPSIPEGTAATDFHEGTSTPEKPVDPEVTFAPVHSIETEGTSAPERPVESDATPAPESPVIPESTPSSEEHVPPEGTPAGPESPVEPVSPEGTYPSTVSQETSAPDQTAVTEGKTLPEVTVVSDESASSAVPIEETPEKTAPEEPSGQTNEVGPGSTVVTAGPSIPSGFTISTEVTAAEKEETTANPEVNTIPGGVEASVVDEESKHPPHIHEIDVKCSKEMMTIDIEFNREFNGVIYSKGFFSNPDCLYVKENSGQTKYTFTVNLEMCGTQFVSGFDTEPSQSYLENVLVIQNELGIQEEWDTVRAVRCLWEGNVKDTLSVAFSIGMLSQEIVTFSGDTAMAKLDVVLGRGPFGEPANGLVKIGEQMTLVVSVSGDPAFDLQVKDCKAVDTAGKTTVALTDEDGCILKPKVFGAFQKTRDTGDSGASIIAYSYFNAFKFPDEMDLMIECNIELCKTDCGICDKEGQQLEPGKRRRRDVSNNTVAGDWITMGKLVRVILPDEINHQTALEVTSKDHICMTIQGFVFSTAVLVSLLVITSFISACLWMKRKDKMYLD